ncbi:MAG: hypothetical protein K2V38_23505 [Gemmataceae bacterium]|nr:hypothetical protein [Gemmataceae bacterium]
MNGNAIVLVVIVVFVIVAFVSVFALICGAFLFIFRANTERSQVALEDAAQRWAAEEGYELISSRPVDRKRDHPFKDRFGVRLRRHGDYGAAVLRIVVEDPEGEKRAGWLYLPLKGRGGVRFGSGAVAVAADWRNAEVAWEEHDRD